ncbi:hypothetical protein HXA35_06020 [Bacillus sp. A301a_S52]|nr:hypothetical protein [Bacillus sp. A301a_S52]
MKKKIVGLLLAAVLTFNPILVNAESSNDLEDALKEQVKVTEKYLNLNVKEHFDNEKEFIDKVNDLHVEFEELLNSTDDPEYVNYNSYEELIDLLDELDLKAAQYNGEISTLSKRWRYGDILIYKSGSKNAIGEKSLTGHSAVLSTRDYYVIEASRTANNGAKVHHWNRNNLWKGASGIKQYKVTTKLGKNATASERRGAVEYGLAQVGKPYKLKTTLWNTNAYYCSKLTNQMWAKQGYDLRSSKAYSIGGIIMILPSDIAADANTRLVKKWGTSTPGKI